MSSALYQSIELLSREKNIDPEIVVGAVEEAYALATRKFYKTQENMRGELDRESGVIKVYSYKIVVATEDDVEDPVNEITVEEAAALAGGAELESGSEIRVYQDTAPLGRIAAQLAKQVIFQKVREAERDTVFNEYAHREKEVISATVKRIEGQDMVVDLGKAEGRMPKREQSRLEQFSIGERIRVVLIKVDRAAKGPQVIVSRAAPELVSNLFQSEVPEIYDNTVVIRAIAREAGERTKIAVMSRDKDVDPVGACVGMKGMRVQSIIRELRGEKIDIIEYNEEITTFAEKALQPAKVSRVSITDLAEKQLEVIVDDTQLSLAIGKKGQNVRLAAKLLGWKIDIKSEEEKRQEVEQQMGTFGAGHTTPIEAVLELGSNIAEKLIAAGITTVEALADMTPEQLEEIPGIGEKTLERISVAVRHYFGQYTEGEVNPNAAAAPVDAESSPSEEAKAIEVDEPGTPDEPVEEATAPMEAHAHASEDVAAEILSVEDQADPERPREIEGETTAGSEVSSEESELAEAESVEPEEVSPAAEHVLEETEAAEEGAIDRGGLAEGENDEKTGDA